MIVLDNRTIFNDLVYNTITAERQNRLRLRAATSTQWDGTLNAQGFILNQNNVVAWKSNTKYTKGDIVIYKNSYWQAANIVQPKEKFDYTDWYKSNYDRIEQGLLQNLATKANQLANSYDTQVANLNSDNDLFSSFRCFNQSCNSLCHSSKLCRSDALEPLHSDIVNIDGNSSRF